MRRWAIACAVLTTGCSSGDGRVVGDEIMTIGSGGAQTAMPDTDGWTPAETQGATTSGTTPGTVDDGSTGVQPGPDDSTSGTQGATDDDESTGTTQAGPDYVLSIDDQGVVARLLQIDTNTGIGSEICLLAPGLNYNSLAFSRDGILFAHSVTDMAIDRVDPCTCDTVRIASGLRGNTQLTADAANGLFGVDLTNDLFVEINPATAVVTTIGPLGVDFAGLGIAWTDPSAGVYALDANTDQLWTIDPQTGAATNPVMLGADFGSVGLDYHPGHDVLYACSSDAMLTAVDPVSGGIQILGEIGGAGCDNLAAPWEPIACLE